ncbi:MAG: tRNA uridine(34) 5-carboxymethylaminomethyl modification radical SAM/GNAT enzyme Elp3 [Thermoplasmatales archaeon B_DKE]|nr:MAG: tRNA uridine(34) 5-carboxymethylaminomethyl modification radical SAM/GNAT enzyme Elp3 [Thermoplasmatales archaeon B_DKE]
MDFYDAIGEKIRSGEVHSKRDLQNLKIKLARELSLDFIPSDVEILNSSNFSADEKNLLRIKNTRTISGVAVVAAMTSPDSCPHGKCLYCPGGVENNSPQSYTGHEPAALRGRNNNYDPYNQVFNRVKQLDLIGHDTTKIDLIIMGGTFTARDQAYQENFVKGCLDAMNGRIGGDLEESLLTNESASKRCIGLTVETKPDWFFEREIDMALNYGTTKVELGVQNLSDRILKINIRGHTLEDVRRSTQLSRDAGLKIVYHIMPGMYGSSYEDDIRSFDLMLSDPAFKPDMLKIYPTLVTRGTSLYRLWKLGKYEPLDTGKAVDLISYLMEKMPPWIRVQRMQRDIPVKFIEAGVKRSDIRNLVSENLKNKGVRSMEIRGREIAGESYSGDIALKTVSYNASGGVEHFISYEDENSRIIGFVRLRLPSENAHRKEILNASIIREIKIFGNVVPLGKHEERGWQHRGLGADLLNEAENISMDSGKHRMLVISGIGVRNYFRKLGYERVGPYMGKAL